MKYLIDTNTVIYLVEDKSEQLRARIQSIDLGEIGISMIVFAELLMGVQLGKPPLAEVLEELARQMPVLPFDENAARSYGKLPFKRGRYDRLLAAHALSLGLTILTTNVRDFADVPGLSVEDWTQ